MPNGKRRILPVFLSSAIETTRYLPTGSIFSALTSFDCSNGPFEAAKDASSLTTQPSISSLVLETTKLASSINTNVLPDVPTTSYSNETSVNLVITTSSVSTTTKESEVKSSSPSQPAWKRKSEAVKTEDASVQQNKKLKDRKSVGSVPVRAESQSQSLPQTSVVNSFSY